MDYKEKKCHDCGCGEGEIHREFCDMERCYKCGGQLTSCYPACDGVIEFSEEKRVPYIEYPNLCHYCGKLWPEFFIVPDEEWEKYIETKMRDTVICRECYDHIKNIIDSNCKN